MTDLGVDFTTIDLVLVKHFPCNTIEELKREERSRCIRELNATLNTRIAGPKGILLAEYYLEEIERITEYALKNSKKLSEYNAKWRAIPENIERQNIRSKTIIKCEICGQESIKPHLLRHQRTEKCLAKKQAIARNEKRSVTYSNSCFEDSNNSRLVLTSTLNQTGNIQLLIAPQDALQSQLHSKFPTTLQFVLHVVCRL
jgi:hypothetical protein